MSQGSGACSLGSAVIVEGCIGVFSVEELHRQGHRLQRIQRISWCLPLQGWQLSLFIMFAAPAGASSQAIMLLSS